MSGKPRFELSRWQKVGGVWGGTVIGLGIGVPLVGIVARTKQQLLGETAAGPLEGVDLALFIALLSLPCLAALILSAFGALSRQSVWFSAAFQSLYFLSMFWPRGTWAVAPAIMPWIWAYLAWKNDRLWTSVERTRARLGARFPGGRM